MIFCCLSLLFLFFFGWLNENIVGTASTVKILRSGKPNNLFYKKASLVIMIQIPHAQVSKRRSEKEVN